LPATTRTVDARPFSLRDMLALVFRRKWVILGIFFVTLAMGVSASLRTTSEFMATAKVLIRRSEASSFQKSRSPFLGLEEEMNTEIEILRSDPVLERSVSYVESELKNVPDDEKAELFPPEDSSEKYHVPTPGWIAKTLQAEPVEQSNVIMIRFRHQNPATARMLADAVANAYVVERIAVRRNPMLESFFQDRSANLRDRLLDLRTELGQLQIESGIYDQEWQQRLNLGTLDELRTDLLRARVRRETEERKLAAVRRKMAENPDIVVPSLEFEDGRPFQELRAKLIDKRTELAELKGRYLPDHPKVQQAEAFVKLMEDVSARRSRRRSRCATVRWVAALGGGLAGEGRARRHQEIDRIPRYEPMLRQIEREIRYRGALGPVDTKMADTQISETEDQRMVNAKVLSPATVTVSFVQQRKSLFALFAALLGLSLGLALAFLMEGLDHSLRTPDDVEINLGVPLLGSIPEFRPLARR
jgi:uncharacterized protein involved in exopolysaccharide biosynthesis